MYSRRVPVGGNRSLEIIVGYAVDAPWKAIGTPNSLMGDVDATLTREADKIASRLSTGKGTVRLSGKGFSADVEQGPPLPAFLPKGVPLPTPGLKIYIYDGKAYIAQTDTNGRLLAVDINRSWWRLVDRLLVCNRISLRERHGPGPQPTVLAELFRFDGNPSAEPR